MKAWEAADIRDFTAKLFLKETFDSFELVEADFTTGIRVELDGHLTEPEKGQVYAEWSLARPLAFQVIRGKQLPHSFHITLRLNDAGTASTLASTGLPFTADEISGLFLNIRYDNRKLMLVTGSSFRTFRMDHTLEREWDKVVLRFLRHHGIPVQEV